jgi:hypothetical protein
LTDAHLMDAKCIHGNIWYECTTCGDEVAELLAATYKEYLENPRD